MEESFESDEDQMYGDEENDEGETIEFDNDQRSLSSEDSFDQKITLPVHEKSIYSIDIWNNYIVTGSEDETGALSVFQNNFISQRKIISGFKDSVVFAKFNCNHELLALVDMAGVIKIFTNNQIKEMASDTLNLNSNENNENSSNITTIIPETTHDLECDVVWAIWHPLYFSLLIIGSETGEIYLLNIEHKINVNDTKNSNSKIDSNTIEASTKWKVRTKILSDGNGIKSCQGLVIHNNSQVVNQNPNTLIVGYEDGTIKLWDMKTGNSTLTLRCMSYAEKSKQTYNYLAHAFEITSLGLYFHQPLRTTSTNKTNDSSSNNSNSILFLLSGDSNGAILLHELSEGKTMTEFTIESIQNFVRSSASQNNTSHDEVAADDFSVEAISFNSHPRYGNNTFFTAHLNGYLVIWDFKAQTPRFVCRNEEGIVKAQWLSHTHEFLSQLIVAAHLDGKISIWNAVNGQLCWNSQTHPDSILDFAISADLSHMFSCSEDGSVSLTNFTEVFPFLNLNTSTPPVT